MSNKFYILDPLKSVHNKKNYAIIKMSLLNILIN